MTSKTDEQFDSRKAFEAAHNKLPRNYMYSDGDEYGWHIWQVARIAPDAIIEAFIEAAQEISNNAEPECHVHDCPDCSGWRPLRDALAKAVKYGTADD